MGRVISQRASLLVALVALAALITGALTLALEVGPQSSGAIIGVADDGYTSDGAVVFPLPGVETAFEAGDVVTAIAGSPLTGWPVAPGSVPTEVGATVPASVIRDGEAMELTVTLVPYPLAEVALTSLGTMGFAIILFVGAVYAFGRRPRDPGAAGLLLFAVGVVGSTPPFLAGIDPLAFARGDFVLQYVLLATVYFLVWAGGLHFALAFPSPHPLVVRRPRLLVAPYLLVYGVLALGALVSFAAGFDGLGAIGAFTVVGNAIAVMALLGFMLLMVLSWRRADVEERRVMRALIITGILAVVGGLALQFIPELLTGAPLLPWPLAGVVGIPFALALVAAVLRHGAFDIDVVLDRSLVYGGMTVGVLVVYVATVSILGTILRGGADYAVALLATALAALTALPIRDLLQRAVDRALFGDRDEPVRAMRRLGERLTLTMDPEAMPTVIVDTVADSLRLPFVALLIGGPEDLHVAAVRGQQPAEDEELVEIPLVSHSVRVGQLRLARRARGEPLSAADRRLLDDLARQVGPAVDNLALNDALRRSRERIVLAGEEERRRLRRDLHDGLGPALAAVGMRAEAAARLLDEDPASARGMLEEVQQGVQTAVADVRRLVDGLRPPALDELGLVGAIEQQAARLGVDAPEFVVESPGPLGELPAGVEVAAYRIAVEAMTNVVRHARARRCQVRLVVDETGAPWRLTLEVRDDGTGIGPGVDPGVGLTSMHDRAAEVGGDVSVEGLPDGGTRVRAWLPLGVT